MGIRDGGSNRTMAIGAGIVLVLVVLCGGALWWQSGADEREAKRLCQESTEADMDTPATAKFHFTSVNGGDGSWFVGGYVDAQNLHGATVRDDFSCRVEMRG